MKVLLDTGVLGLVTHPKTAVGGSCALWMRGLIAAGVEVIVPEICDYELRRKYLHINSTNGIKKLNELGQALRFESVDTNVWRQAADIWAQCRRSGKILAPDDALDGDVLLISLTQGVEGALEAPEDVVVATTNVKHLEDFVSAKEWDQIALP